ncbi:MAG: DUF1080 domain-containing protein [Acidobacteria bacterium]|nr:DUF1080 domain-containing protein [Acidobacteriota bacterium]MBI3264990.1 DUF1080 domain-containing protein [Acidobacteriota bacterium]
MKSICTCIGASICLVLASFLVASVVVTSPTLWAQSPGAWKTLFNGKDFTDWVVPPSAGRGGGRSGGNAAAPAPAPAGPRNPAAVGWKIENGVIVGGQAPEGQRGGSLTSVDKFKDVELEFDFMLAEHGTKCSAALVGPNQANASEERTCTYNSGVYLRTGYQVNLGRREAGEFIGVVIHRQSPKAIRGNVLWLDTGDCGGLREYPTSCDKFPNLRKKDDWNHMRITFKGPRLQVWLNGTKISDLTDDPTDPAEASWKEAAPIWFQWPPAGESGGFAGYVKYKNIRAREI